VGGGANEASLAASPPVYVEEPGHLVIITYSRDLVFQPLVNPGQVVLLLSLFFIAKNPVTV